MVEETTYRVRTPIFPVYSEVRALLKIWPGFAKKAVLTLINALMEQTGTPQDPVDWTDPDTWIPDRLSGENAALAEKIWRESGKQVNPRHVYGSYLFINTYELLVPDLHGIYQLTERGKRFLADDESVVRPIDDQLRGALPYHGAIRGTIITLGKFAKGCKDAAIYPGAAPITLIDGDKLIELLVKHEIGLVKRRVDLIEVDTAFFDERREIEAEVVEEIDAVEDAPAVID